MDELTKVYIKRTSEKMGDQMGDQIIADALGYYISAFGAKAGGEGGIRTHVHPFGT